MVQGCGSKMIKCMMIFVNTIFFISGAIAVGTGLWLILGDTKAMLDHELTDKNKVFVILFIIVGGVTFILGFLGCFGAAAENKCLLGLFFACSTVVFLVEAAIAIVILGSLVETEGIHVDPDNMDNVGYGFLAIAVFHLLGMIFSMVLCCNINHTVQSQYYVDGRRGQTSYVAR